MSDAISSNGHGKNGSSTPLANGRPAIALAPPVDVYENEDEFLVTVDVPGARADSVKVELEHERISISARAEAVAASDGHPARRPRDYQRSFVVPDGIDGAAITAELGQGVLRVRLPKSAARKPRVIPVRGPAS
jgi:HSP20 family protein